MKKNRTARALLMSTLSLLLCVSMLVGSTFAWFTDSVVSANNIIKSGNLDIELYYMQENGQYIEVGTESLFTDTLWEPGHVEVVNLKIANKGSLALKYQFNVSVLKETGSVNQADEEFKLSDFIQFAVVPGELTGNREQAVAAAKQVGPAVLNQLDWSVPGTMEAGAEDQFVTMVVWMPETVDNKANHKTGVAAPEITLGINLFATQYTVELDSFDEFYDKGAAWTGDMDLGFYFENPDADVFEIGSAEELAALAAIVNTGVQAPATTFSTRAAELVQDDFKGKTIKLTANIDLRDIKWTPIGTNENPFRGNFDGQNYTVSNLNVSNSGWAGLFGHVGLGGGSTIKNIKINGATIRSNRMAGAVVGQLYGSLENCHATDVEIVVIPNAVGSTYDNGDKVGGIVGWLGDNGNNRTVTNCSVTNATVSAYRDVGGIVGYAANTTTLSGNKVSSVEIIVDQSTNNYGDKEPNAGEIWGRAGGSAVTGENNTSSEVAFNVTYSKNGLTLKADPAAGTVTMYLVPEEYTETTVNVPEGVTNIGGYAFAYNTNVKKIVLPSSVETLNDRAFRDTSASQVVLNEGLTNISYQAFRNAGNVKSVVIPSTVKTISKEAFQNSGITTLTIPATVDTLEYGACRDMKELKTVVIEGNVDVPVYAFRCCTNLKTVILTGDDVTFGAGSKGMIFTNKENGDGSAITVYVENETVKERLLAADTAAKDYGGYKIVVGATVIEDAASLQNALNESGEIVLIGDIALGNTAINVPAGVEAVLNLGEYTISSGNTDTETHNDMFLVKGKLTVNGGKIIMNHTGANMGWSGCTNTFDITAGGVLNLNNTYVENKGGTDMNFAVHMNNWGEVTVNIVDSTLKATYMPVRVYNSGPDMNNVTIEGSTLESTGGNFCFWVHNYASADFNGKVYSGSSVAYDEAQVAARLNFDIFGNGNTFITGKTAPVRYGFNSSVLFDANGNVVS